MRDDPIFSGGVVKAVLLILVVAGLGFGAYKLVGGIDLPELETDTGPSVNLTETELEDITIDGEIEPGDTVEAETPVPIDPFTTAGFAQALALVKAAVGPSRALTRLFINPTQTQMIVRSGDGVEAWSVRADTGELVREDATITISGNAKVDDFAFALDGIKAGAVDRMLADAERQSGAPDFTPTVLSLERAIPFGSRELEWTINAEGGARNLLYRAAADGRGVRSEGGGSPIPPAAQEARKLNECIEAAGNDPEQIFACLDQFQ
jgi:hypothetical protein